MAKAERLEEQRRLIGANAARVERRRRAARRMRPVWGTAAALVVGAAAIAGLLPATRSSPKPPPPAPASAADRNAPASLVKEADAVGFRPTTDPGVGEIENRPAAAARPPSNPALLAAGTKAPAFTLKTPQGRRISLASFRGRAVLLEFFATWCSHCNAEAPHLRRLSASLPTRKVAFVSVDADGEDAASVFAFHRYYGLRYPALLDPGSQVGSFHRRGAAGPVTTAYRVRWYPTFYVLDPRGRISWRSDGEQPDRLLAEQLLKAAGSG